jgi:hypothetical protein
MHGPEPASSFERFAWRKTTPSHGVVLDNVLSLY